MSEFPIPFFPPLVTLILFAVWTLLLVITIGTWRFTQFLTGTVPKGGFNPGAPHGSDAYWRVNRAHLNAVENLPIFAVVVFSGVYLSVQNPMFETLANVVLGARFVQSLIHISSGAQLMVLLRFTFYLIQVLSMLAMAAMVLPAAGMAV
jgi:uncharacterized MAPEG superfamily protein